jgi:tetratricopeptide (TPR) repeat protein
MMKGAVLWTSFTIVCGLFVVTAPSAAADDSDAYHRVIEEALQEFNYGNWDEAAVLFERAHRINPSARTERGMGMAAFEARHYVAAIAHLSAALSEQRKPLTAAQRDEVERALSRARGYVARLELDVQPSDARVRINGHLVDADANGGRLADPGVQELEIAAEGYEPLLRRIHLAPGKRESLEIRLQPLASASTIELTSAALEPAAMDEQSTGALKTWKWLLGAGGLVGLAAGSAFLIAQKSEADRFNTSCDFDMLTERCAALERSAGGRWYVGSIVAFGLGAGLLSASAVLFMLDGAEPRREHAEHNGCRLGFADLGVACSFAL